MSKKEIGTQLKLRGLVLLCAAIACSQPVQAQSWQATTGAQSPGKGRQALAFLPSELWIHAEDSITWTFPADEPHTVTFLKAGQIRPSATAGCPGTTPDGSAFDGSVCVNSGRIGTAGTTYTVTFPIPGNYRLVCLVPTNMTGLVHVLPPSEPLPHDQDFYDDQAAYERHDLLFDHDAHHNSGEDMNRNSMRLWEALNELNHDGPRWPWNLGGGMAHWSCLRIHGSPTSSPTTFGYWR